MRKTLYDNLNRNIWVNTVTMDECELRFPPLLQMHRVSTSIFTRRPLSSDAARFDALPLPFSILYGHHIARSSSRCGHDCVINEQNSLFFRTNKWFRCAFCCVQLHYFFLFLRPRTDYTATPVRTTFCSLLIKL